MTRNTGLLIGGAWRDASDGATIGVQNPATEKLLATVASASVEDAIDAVEAADSAGEAWAQTPPRTRGEYLRSLFDLLTERQDEFTQLLVDENGKAWSEAAAEAAYGAEFLRWYSEEAVRILGSFGTAPAGANKMLVTRQPIGVSVMVTPWNFPLAMITRKVGPALAAGCTVVVKPASETPLTALAFGALAEEVGIPPGVINVIPSSRSSATVSAMLNDPRVRKLSFTGSTEVGRRLLATAAETVTKCSMELGGNAPFIVFEDADLDVAVSAALTAKMRNGGESCTAANRFYVQRPVAQQFAERLAKEMSALKLGPGDADGVHVGPLINHDACDSIGELVASTVEAGATLVTGGFAPEGPGHFFEPTVLADVPTSAEILSEEIFGPVAPVVAFDTEDEAVALANGTDLGLVAFVASRDLSKCMRVAERIEAGMVGINRGIVSDPAAPFGGWKQSGVGREGAHEGLLEYLETKYIAVDW